MDTFAQTGREIPRRVLVVDDDDGLRTLIVQSLQKADFDAGDAPNGAKAIESAAADSTLVLLLNHQLPDMTGRDLIDALAERGLKVPVVIITEQGDVRLAVELMKLGAADYLVKGPDLLDRLPGVVRDITARKQAEEALRQREYYLSSIIENQPGLVWLKDAENRFLAVNQNFAKSCGLALPELLVGKTDFDIWPPELAEKYRAVDAKVMASGASSVVEEPIFDQGETRWFETFKTPVFDERGIVIGTTGYARDITARKQAEQSQQQLLERVQRQQTTVVALSLHPAFSAGDAAAAARFLTETVAETLDVARASVWLFENEETELHCQDLYLRDGAAHQFGHALVATDFPAYFAALKQGRAIDAYDACTDPRTREFGETYLKPNGITSMLDAAIRLSGAMVGVVCLEHVGDPRAWQADELTFAGEVADQMAQVLANAKRKRAEELLQDIIEKNPMSIQIVDKEGYTLQVNAAHTRLFGAVPPPDYSVFADFQVEQQGCQGLFERVRNGEVVHFPDFAYNVHTLTPEFPDNPVSIRMVIFPLFDKSGHPERFVLMHEDITARKRAEEALLENVRRWQQAQSIAKIGNWEFDMATGQIWGSEEAFRIFGLELNLAENPQQLLSLDRVEARIPARQRVHQALIDLIQKNQPYDLEYEVIREIDAQRVMIHSVAVRVDDNQGQLSKIAGTIQDVTAAKQMEQALRESLEKYRVLFESFPLGITVSDETGNILEVNRASERLLGLSVQAHGQRRIDGPEWQIIRPDGSPMPAAEYASVRALAENRLVENVEMGIVKADRDIVWLNVTAAPIPLAGYGVAVAYGDITEQVRMEQQLVRQERLAAVGQLTAGIAHDFNNILTGILGYTELLQQSPETPASLQADLQKINNSARRAAKLVRQLLDFSRKTIRRPEQLNLASFVARTFDFLKAVIPENVRINLNVGPGDYLIAADPTQLEQVITNLAVNARDAMPNGGELRIGLARVECKGTSQCALCNHPIAGEWVQLQITDTGSGIAADVLPRIFEPFFTTKEVGQGVGLGLSQLYGIVKQHGGHITVASRVGQGATFTIYLPPAGAKEKPPATEPVQMKPGQGETILLVEDDPTVLGVITAMLEQLGYQVIPVSKGIEAIAIFENHNSQIALVLSDMVMPDMDGAELFDCLKAKAPQVKMVIMSGYPLGESGATLLEQGVIAWFEKPMSFEELAQAVGQALKPTNL